jgi:hypothetical protein
LVKLFQPLLPASYRRLDLRKAGDHSALQFEQSINRLGIRATPIGVRRFACAYGKNSLTRLASLKTPAPYLWIDDLSQP